MKRFGGPIDHLLCEVRAHVGRMRQRTTPLAMMTIKTRLHRSAISMHVNDSPYSIVTGHWSSAINVINHY